LQVVSNSTILIALSRIGHLWLLEKLFSELIIPQAVYNDVVVKGAGKPGSKDVAEAKWIQVFDVKNTDALDEFISIIGIRQRFMMKRDFQKLATRNR